MSDRVGDEFTLSGRRVRVVERHLVERVDAKGRAYSYVVLIVEDI